MPPPTEPERLPRGAHIFSLARSVVAQALELGPTTPKPTEWVGSALYVAPEIDDGKEYGLSADVFSFGVMAYELYHVADTGYDFYGEGMDLFDEGGYTPQREGPNPRLCLLRLSAPLLRTGLRVSLWWWQRRGGAARRARAAQGGASAVPAAPGQLRHRRGLGAAVRVHARRARGAAVVCGGGEQGGRVPHPGGRQALELALSCESGTCRVLRRAEAWRGVRAVRA